ncbi:hypothetical protein [Nocardioides sp. L-11A]|uniref:recombination directionality factor n=1 Tax=Nocardioides sp. L-11A TaxID=3043848 RepID=UPI00249C0A21|nr:hypothetical protein QJ852_10000 [Nocardioides sp. L-11A]
MPIITTQRRMPEQGRIRLGQKITGTNKSGREYTRPAKLDRFRFTSASQRLINEIATTYGGDARPWDNDGKSEFEVITDATAIPVIVVKGGFSQWHEHWTKAGIQHRCDGEKDAAGTYCDPQDPNHIAAVEKPTTRLSVMLSEIESLGVWRMESKGWNAAAELPSMAELAMHVGDLVPATLGLAERSSIIQTDRGPQTSRFVVPFLDLHVTKQRLVEIVGGPGGAPAIEGDGAGAAAVEQQPAALPSSTPAEQGAVVEDAYTPYFARLGQQKTLDALQGVWKEAVDAKLVGQAAPTNPAASPTRVAEFTAEFRRYAQDIKAAQEATASPADPADPAGPAGPAGPVDADGVVEAELVPDPAPQDAPQAASDAGTPQADPGPDADAVWQQIVNEAGQHGMTLADVQDHFTKVMGGLTCDSASAAELQHYLTQLKTGAAA